MYTFCFFNEISIQFRKKKKKNTNWVVLISDWTNKTSQFWSVQYYDDFVWIRPNKQSVPGWTGRTGWSIPIFQHWGFDILKTKAPVNAGNKPCSAPVPLQKFWTQKMSLGYAQKLSYKEDVGTVGMSEIFDPPRVLQRKVSSFSSWSHILEEFFFFFFLKKKSL